MVRLASVQVLYTREYHSGIDCATAGSSPEPGIFDRASVVAARTSCRADEKRGTVDTGHLSRMEGQVEAGCG
jgi:hypothetical protein